MQEMCTRCLILARLNCRYEFTDNCRYEFTDRRNGIEMPDWSRVSSIELERADDSSTNSYNSLGDCCRRFVFLEQFQLPISCGILLQIF